MAKRRNNPLAGVSLSRTLLASTALVACVTTAMPAAAQAPATAVPTDAVFRPGHYYGGPHVWLGNLNGAIAIGGQVERGFTQPGQYGPGIIAAGVGVDYYSWNQSFGIGRYEYSVIPIQAFGNYHIPIQTLPRLDPYVGLAVVYQVVSSSWDGSGIGGSAAASSTDIAGQLGARYFLSDQMALQGQVGFGYGTLGLGATWRFR